MNGVPLLTLLRKLKYPVKGFDAARQLKLDEVSDGMNLLYRGKYQEYLFVVKGRYSPTKKLLEEW